MFHSGYLVKIFVELLMIITQNIKPCLRTNSSSSSEMSVKRLILQALQRSHNHSSISCGQDWNIRARIQEVSVSFQFVPHRTGTGSHPLLLLYKSFCAESSWGLLSWIGFSKPLGRRESNRRCF